MKRILALLASVLTTSALLSCTAGGDVDEAAPNRTRQPVSPTSLWNAAGPIVTPTYDGSGSAVHPDVIDFGPAGWNGWRFWMAMTPYPGQNSDYENPSILVSHDGETWQVPDGLTNPLYSSPPVGWYSDTDLSFDPETDELVLVFRGSDFAPRVARSADGVLWPSSPTIVDWTTVGAQSASPTLVRVSDTEWWMWQVVKLSERSKGGPRAVYRWSAPAPEGPWGRPTLCTGFPANSPDDPTIWHADVVLFGGEFLMIAAEGREDENPSSLHTATSRDGLEWDYSSSPIVAEGSGGGWDTGHLYRGTIQPAEDGRSIRLWYSGRPEIGLLYRLFRYSAGDYRIGLTLIPLSEWRDP